MKAESDSKGGVPSDCQGRVEVHAADVVLDLTAEEAESPIVAVAWAARQRAPLP